MSESFKYLLIILAVIGPVSGIFVFFINLEWALLLFSIYGIALIILLVVFVLDRKKEKQEEINYDDCDY